MLDRLQVRNFQSLVAVDLALAPLTVIVGPSSSGKSAFIRSLQALTRNRRGTEFITHGERTASISAHVTQGIVTLTRSTQTAPNSYTLIPADAHHPLHPKAEFSKLGGDVPAPVSTFMGILPSNVPLSIASQFDPPYLLSASSTEAARIFGTLTNASVLLDASRESNRRKLAATALLRTRTQDLALITQRVPEFRALKAQSTALTRADALIARARTLAQRLSDLTTASDTLQIAQQRIPALTAALSALPDPTALSTALDALQARHTSLSRSRDQILTRITLFHTALTRLSTLHATLKTAHALVASTETAVTSATQDLAQALSGFEKALAAHMLAEARTLTPDQKIDVSEAARLATAYVTSLEG